MTYPLAPHAGVRLQLLLSQHGVTQEEAAAALGTSRVAVNELCRGRRSISPAIALRLERAFPSVPACEWMRWQAEYDLGQAAAQIGGSLDEIHRLEPLGNN